MPFFIVMLINKIKRSHSLKVISIHTFLLCLCLTVILVSYILCNTSDEQIKFIWNVSPITIKSFAVFILFAILEYLGIIMFTVLFNKNADRRYLLFTGVIIFIFTLLHMGKWNDFCMRTTIPALIILFIEFVKCVFEIFDNKLFIHKFIVLTIIFIMSYNAINGLYITTISVIKTHYIYSLHDEWGTILHTPEDIIGQYI